MSDRDEKFHINLIRGQIGKEIARSLLEKSDYKVYSLGYEGSLSHLRYAVKKRKAPNTESNNRLRSTPDLMVYDDNEHKMHFVEVKFSNPTDARHIRLNLKPLRWYKRYWHDSILVLVVPPSKRVYYAQEISALKIDEDPSHWWTRYNLEEDFRPISMIFPKVRDETIEKFQPVLNEFTKLKEVDDDE
jgi:hypothetical protein